MNNRLLNNELNKSLVMKYFLIACFTAAMLASCSSSRNAAQLSELAGDWQLTVFPNATKPFAEFFTMKMPELQLSSTDRRVAGNTGCNRITGSFAINGEEFRFNNFATTKMGCPGYDENIYLDALNRVNRFRLNADQLSLLQDSTLLMTFVKKTGTQ
jgi:heat shock protein HslJ